MTIAVIGKPIEAETGRIRAYCARNVAIIISRVTSEGCPLPLRHHLIIYMCAADPLPPAVRDPPMPNGTLTFTSVGQVNVSVVGIVVFTSVTFLL